MTAFKVCTRCNKSNRPQARFCGYCGQPFAPSVFEQDGRSHGTPTHPSTSAQKLAPGRHRTEAPERKRQLPKSMLLSLIISALVGLLGVYQSHSRPIRRVRPAPIHPVGQNS